MDTNLSTDPSSSDEVVSEDTPATLPNLAVPDMSLPQPSQPLEEAMTPAPPTADLSTGLVGQNIDAVMPMLEQAGWMVVTRTPQLIQLDRDGQGLDLGIEGSTGEVMEAELIDL
ncbi:MAG: hypothetical protein HC922_01720 [Leptolyngbyaceae cyanobacterium SM2_3_12]|nr:hypothetical protein [Leptolyngbyaceae cyanobacterium SM2_3_12]